ncbi:MAG: NAD-dependent epimerase/dehydratase family protein [Bacteroidota bacterium]
MELKIILTGATGMVGEGVLLECLEHPDVNEVLMINRRPINLKHPKLKECIVPDFFYIEEFKDQLKGYDACFFCAGISSAGMGEQEYTRITYETTMHFANVLAGINPTIIFNFVSGAHTDSSEKGRIMWARVKGKTENALMRLPFKRVYNFRPGFMKPTPGQKNIKGYYKVIGSFYPFLLMVFPNNVSTMKEVGLSMINSVRKGYSKQVLEIKDIKVLAKG